MIDHKSLLLLVEPIHFYDVCTIYHPTVLEILNIDEQQYASLMLPYVMSDDLFDGEYENMSIYDIIFKEDKYLYLYLSSLKWLCKTDDVKYSPQTKEVFIDESQHSLNKDNFDEFCNIVLDMNYKQKYKKEVIVEPKFKTEDGKQRWDNLQKHREKNKKKDDSLELHNIINVVQIGGGFYIHENEIKNWSMYKLINTYTTILNHDSGNKMFDVFLQTGSKDLIKKDITELLQVV